MTYTAEQLRTLFQHTFSLKDWTEFLIHFMGAQTMRQKPEPLQLDPAQGNGFFLGQKSTTDGYEVGLFYVETLQSVSHRRVGLRQLIKPYLSYLVDAALVVFDDGHNWRLSFICDLKGENTAPKRYTFVFGDSSNYYNTAVSRFAALQAKDISFANLMEAFSVEALSKDFYTQLYAWYLWAVDPATGVSFPRHANAEDEVDGIETKIIRMITRIMFVWFIKQKDLVPQQLFDPAHLAHILHGFDPLSTTEGNYYNAILQNLFFATLNRAIKDEDGAKRRFAKAASRDIKTLYRYEELFAIPEEQVVELFANVPFLNGGLFECLDKTRTLHGVEHCFNYDGFSRNPARTADGRYKHRATVPNVLFFHPERGLLSLLSRYNFTIEENSPEEQQVALDPELLGKVFENLLGAYNPETRETARNQSGSFYTPREIVNYMVDESLIAYLGDSPTVRAVFHPDFVPDELHWADYQRIAGMLKSVKIFDPACGSGAFPMGLLNRIVDILGRIETDTTSYDLKLKIIENCLYGSDIQSIAAQITKLRFFISLICDCEKDESKPNYGIPTLPNLETKFVAANTLIAKKKQAQMGNLFENPDIARLQQELQAIRHKHFSARSATTKRHLREQDQQLREELAKLLAENNDFAPEQAKQLAAWNPYDQNAVATFFDPEWMFGVAEGFDIVIGNPPYIQLQNNGGEQARLYQACGYQTFARTGDIYCLFYERGYELLKQGGHLCFITSNKWMRAGYGEKTRAFFATKTNPKLLIDFAGVRIFESATVDTNILLFAREANQHQTRAVVANKQYKTMSGDLGDFVQQASTPSDFATSESWVILTPIEQSIKRKIEAVGTPLKDWDINIYRGVLTGCNEAFIISTEKREEILGACQTEDERKKTADLIRPILRGRDIKRYGYEWANLWLIATFPARHYDIEDYPAVKKYLLSFGKERLEQTGKTHIVNGIKVKARKKTNNKWFETQDSISYFDDFMRPKIVWAELARTGNAFAVDLSEYTVGNTGYILTVENNNKELLYYLLGFLNSRVTLYCLNQITSRFDENGWRWLRQFVEQLRVPISSETGIIANLVCDANRENQSIISEQINKIVARIYGFSEEEQTYIDTLLAGY